MPMPYKTRNKCLYCSKECNRPEAVYCSNDCQHKYQYEEAYDLWKDNKYTGSTSKRIKSFLTTMHGYKCAVCGIDHWQGKELVLELDHIDGDWQDDRPANVRLICPNCHSQTDTYKNRGGQQSGRTHRIDYPSRYNRYG